MFFFRFCRPKPLPDVFHKRVPTLGAPFLFLQASVCGVSDGRFQPFIHRPYKSVGPASENTFWMCHDYQCTVHSVW